MSSYFIFFEGLPSCDRNLTCGINADCFKINNTDTCVCDPGHRNTSNTCTSKCCLFCCHSCFSHLCFLVGLRKYPYTHPKEGHWTFWGVGWRSALGVMGGGVGWGGEEPKCIKVRMKLSWNFRFLEGCMGAGKCKAGMGGGGGGGWMFPEATQY